MIPYQSHSLTSKAAATKAVTLTTPSRAKVLAYLTSQGSDGATDEECQLALKMNPSTQRPRRIELVEAGVVKDSGICRQTLSGCDAVVWVVI